MPQIARPHGEAAVEVQLDDLATEDLLGADAAVVAALRGREAALGEAERARALEEGVLLLDAEDRLLSGELLGDRAQQGAGVRDVRRAVDLVDLAQDEDVVAATDRVREGRDRLKNAVRRVTLGLVGGRAVEAPGGDLVRVGQDPSLGAELGGRLRAVDPDVLGLDCHGGEPRKLSGGCPRSVASRRFPVVPPM